MSTGVEEQYNVLRQQIHNSLQKADAQEDKLKRANARYGIVNLILSALAAFVAGQAAFFSSKEPAGGWRITCGIASVLALGATVTAGVQKQLADPGLLTEASQCVGKLKALKVDTITPTYNLEEVREKYQQILSDFSRVDC